MAELIAILGGLLAHSSGPLRELGALVYCASGLAAGGAVPSRLIWEGAGLGVLAAAAVIAVDVCLDRRRRRPIDSNGRG